MVVQLAKQEGLKVIGSTGSDEKVQFLKELGVDVAFNYNTTDMRNILYQEGPIDMCVVHPSKRGSRTNMAERCRYWDNVGGDTLDAVLENSNPGAKVIVSSMQLSSLLRFVQLCVRSSAVRSVGTTTSPTQ